MFHDSIHPNNTLVLRSQQQCRYCVKSLHIQIHIYSKLISFVLLTCCSRHGVNKVTMASQQGVNNIAMWLIMFKIIDGIVLYPGHVLQITQALSAGYMTQIVVYLMNFCPSLETIMFWL